MNSSNLLLLKEINLSYRCIDDLKVTLLPHMIMDFPLFAMVKWVSLLVDVYCPQGGFYMYLSIFNISLDFSAIYFSHFGGH